MKIKDEPFVITIAGSKINNISSFYEAINTLFMQGENWRIGESLDALDDMLYGGYGLLESQTAIELRWEDHRVSAKALGRELTRDYYLGKLLPGSPSNKDFFIQKLAELDAGRGETYFEKIVAVMLSHRNLRLILL